MARARSRWREAARSVIRNVLSGLPEFSERVARAALYDAYPFGPRKYHPYRIWCEEVQKALAVPPGSKKAGWVLTGGLNLLLRCRWCEREVGLASMTCLQCLPEWERVEGLFEHSDFKPLLLAARADPDDRLRRGVLADWLRDRGEDELADLFGVAGGEDS